MPLKSYMENQKGAIHKTYFLIRFSDDAIRPSKNHSFLRWKESYPFWRSISPAPFLQTDTIATPFVSKANLYPTQQSLQCSRGNVSIDLPHYIRDRTDRNVPSLKTKWCLSIPHRITHLSQSNDPATFSSSDGAIGSSQVEKTARPITLTNDPKTKTPHQSDLRSGLHRSYSLWQTGNGPNRLQSQEVGPSFLSSASLFQWNHQGFLAWRTSSWRYPYRHWNRGTSKGLLCQITSLCKESNYSSRQGFLRSRDHRISRIQQSPFRHCGQADGSSQKRNLRSFLSDPFLWSGDRGIYVSTHEMEKEISFCGGQASDPRRPYGTTHPFLDGQIQLSGSCDQHETDPSQHLEILQWPSCCRIDYQRAKRGLPLRKNPDEAFCSQRGLLSYSSFILQSHQLVQAVMSTKGVSEHDT